MKFSINRKRITGDISYQPSITHEFYTWSDGSEYHMDERDVIHLYSLDELIALVYHAGGDITISLSPPNDEDGTLDAGLTITDED